MAQSSLTDPFADTDARDLAEAAHDPRAAASAVASAVESAGAAYNAQIRSLIVDKSRVDVLMKEVLGLECAEHHLRMLRHQAQNKRRNMQIIWRGAGKTLGGTCAYALARILKNPDIRIAIVSWSSDNASDMLKVIKNWIDHCEKLRGIFGDLRGPKWDENEIIVSTRQKTGLKEATVTCIGAKSAVASGHYDLILIDDLEVEESVQTLGLRQKLKRFFWKTLIPCLEPDGDLSIRGTFYHPEGLLMEFAGKVKNLEGYFGGPKTLIIPALVGSDAEGWVSSWPDKFPLAELLERKKFGGIEFWSQYMCDVSIMEGDIFKWDDIVYVDAKDVPEDLPIGVGYDLAISEKETGHYFAETTIKYDHLTDMVYVIDHYEDKLPFHRQRERVENTFDQRGPSRVAMEVNAYQGSLFGEVLRLNPRMRGHMVRIDTSKDKTLRAWQMQPRFAGRRIVFVRGVPFVDHLVQTILRMPTLPDDGFDSLDHAIGGMVSKKGVRKTREQEPGLFRM